MKHAMKKNLAALEPKLEAQNAYTANLRRQFIGTVWKSGCSSWYLNKDGDVRIKNNFTYKGMLIYITN
jgi:hypothetical protein